MCDQGNPKCIPVTLAIIGDSDWYTSSPKGNIFIIRIPVKAVLYASMYRLNDKQKKLQMEITELDQHI